MGVSIETIRRYSDEIPKIVVRPRGTLQRSKIHFTHESEKALTFALALWDMGFEKPERESIRKQIKNGRILISELRDKIKSAPFQEVIQSLHEKGVKLLQRDQFERFVSE